MKHLKIVFALLLVSAGAFAQSKVVDSLKNKLAAATNDIKKIELLNEIANEYVENNPAIMMQYSKKALALALGLPSTIIGVFFLFQEIVKLGYISQGVAQGILIAVVSLILLKMIQVSWKKK